MSVADPTISRHKEATDHAPSPLVAAILKGDEVTEDRRLAAGLWLKVEGPGVTKADTEGSRTRNTESLMVSRQRGRGRLAVVC